ncbi:sigma-70 family RNA polymerase sigma factor [Streptomyces sp. NPDC002785]|uniref:sigma-70 family RNA polymerase sigma factor n=1 Tax=Streptomyces sp. NPDC002785 TaxID=3154543 RepID=UPI0033231017
MSGDGQQEESFDDVSAVGGVAEAGGPSSRQIPSQAGPGRSGGDAEGGTVLPGPWSAPVEAGVETDIAVPMQRKGGHTTATDASGSAFSGSAFSDAELIKQMRRDGDDLAYEELFRRHSDAVRRYARTCCRDAHTADDLTAEVFARTLQAVRRGKGPEEAVRAYLMTAVRHVGAAWTKTAKREQLVDDFAVFAAQASQSSQVSDVDTLDLGAEVLAMHEAEQSMAMQAFRSLPERWQAVLWHTTVEEESPSEIAPLFGLTANATAVLASRAREGLKQAYLQAHVSQALTSGGDCARYADRLGAYARGGLRMRAERGLRGHLDECLKCRLAAGELAHVNAGIPALLPVAVIGWFAAGYALKAAGIVAGGAAGAAGAGAAAAATGGSSSGGAAGGAALSEGLGAPVKAGIAAAVAAAVTAGLAWALVGDDQPKPEARHAAKPAAVAPAVPTPAPPKHAPPKPGAPKHAPPEPAPPKPTPPEPAPPKHAPPKPEAPAPPAPPAPSPTPPPKSTPTPNPARTPTPEPTPPPKPSTPPAKPKPPAPASTPPPPPAPTVYRLSELSYSMLGDHTRPEVVISESNWVWQRSNLSIGGTQYAHGVTVHTKSSVTIQLNRQCTRYEAMVGVDDMTRGRGSVRFSVFNRDGTRLWQSPVVNRNDPAIPVRVGITGQERIRLVVERVHPGGGVALADWAHSTISCR